MKEKKILIVKLGAIGDVIMAMSSAYYLKRKYNCHITWVCGKSVYPLLKRSSHIDNFIVLDHEKILSGSYFQKIKELGRAWRKLAFKEFNTIATLQKDNRYKLLTLFTRRKSHKYFHKNDLFPLSDNFHSMDYINLISEPEHSTPSIREWNSVKKPSQLESMIVLSPGGMVSDGEKMNRAWPLESYVQLAASLIDQKYKVVVVGDKSHKLYEKQFIDLGVESLIGKTNLEDLLQLLNRSKLLVTHDGGIFHLGRMAACKRIGLFGPTNFVNFSDVNDPTEKVITTSMNLPCMPCYNGKRYAQCSHKSCMSSIQVNQVLQLIKTWAFSS